MEDAQDSVPDVHWHIDYLVSSNYGSWIEMAYEISWEEAQDILEILAIKEEAKIRNEITKRAENAAQ